MLTTTVVAPKGATWTPWHVTRNAGKSNEVELETLHLVFNDVDGAKAHFGESMLAFLDGTSFRVWQDGLWRKDSKMSVDMICARIVAHRPGLRSTTVNTSCKAADGKFYATEAEAQAASLAWAFDEMERQNNLEK